MTTKTCQYCKEEMKDAATKCPHCSSYQKWTQAPAFLFFLASLIFILPSFYLQFNRLKTGHFESDKDQIHLKVLKESLLEKEEETFINILVEVENETDKAWENATYEVAYESSSGELMNIEKKLDYKFYVAPNSKAKSSIKVPFYEDYKDTDLKVRLVHLKSNRF